MSESCLFQREFFREEYKIKTQTDFLILCSVAWRVWILIQSTYPLSSTWWRDSFRAKVADTIAETKAVDLQYHYRDAFGKDSIPEAYERLLVDAINGDASVFTRGDRSEFVRELIDPILQAQEDPHGPQLAIMSRGQLRRILCQRLMRINGSAVVEIINKGNWYAWSNNNRFI